jgi:hypothetical protein
VDITTLGLGGEDPQAHVFEHALAQWGHRDLLRERDSVARSNLTECDPSARSAGPE